MSRIRNLFLISMFALATLSALSGVAHAQDAYSWQVNYQHVTLDVDSSNNVYMTYQVDANIQQGNWNEVWIPETVDNMQVTSVTDGNGQSHGFYVDAGQIKTQGWNLNPDDHVSLVIKSTLPGFVYQSDAAGYDIVQFTPPWWDMVIQDSTGNVNSTQVEYLLPGAVNYSDVYTGNGNYQRDYSGIGTDPATGRTVVFFNSTILGDNQQFNTAVSFPDSYMSAGAVTSAGPSSSSSTDYGGLVSGLLGSACCGFWIIVPVIVFLFVLIGAGSRRPYGSPSLSMNGMGVNQNLDPVEAAMLLRIDPRRILTMIMFGMLKKGNVRLISTDPLRLELVSKKDANYYEALFADAIKNDTLDEDRLLACFKALAQRVVDKTRAFSRKDTEAFYQKKIDDAWKDVEAVDTPELKLQKYDTNMFWLMADQQFADRTTTSLRTPNWGAVAVPPYYWWYPYTFGIPRGAPAPATGQPQPAGAPSTNQTTSSVESFAKNFTNSVEKTSAGVVGSVDSFLGIRNAANAPPAVHTPAHVSGGSSCACVSCACACAHCACACACAGGGHGCT